MTISRAKSKRRQLNSKRSSRKEWLSSNQSSTWRTKLKILRKLSTDKIPSQLKMLSNMPKRSRLSTWGRSSITIRNVWSTLITTPTFWAISNLQSNLWPKESPKPSQKSQPTLKTSSAWRRESKKRNSDRSRCTQNWSNSKRNSATIKSWSLLCRKRLRRTMIKFRVTSRSDTVWSNRSE